MILTGVALGAVGIVAAALLLLPRGGNQAPAPRTAQGGAMALGTQRGPVEAEGEIEPLEEVEVLAPVTGALRLVGVKEGDRVAKGQVLAEYDAGDLALRVQQARAQLASARANAASLRAKFDVDEQVRAEEVRAAEARLAELEGADRRTAGNADQSTDLQQALDSARRDLEAVKEAQVQARTAQARDEQLAAADESVALAERTLEQALADARRQRVLAPIDGLVLSREATRNGQVAKGAVLFVLADLGRIVVRAEVDQVDVGRVAPGDAADVWLSTDPGKTYAGRVVRISAKGRRTGSLSGQNDLPVFDVWALLENPRGLLRPGMKVNVRIRVGEGGK